MRIQIDKCEVLHYTYFIFPYILAINYFNIFFPENILYDEKIYTFQISEEIITFFLSE